MLSKLRSDYQDKPPSIIGVVYGIEFASENNDKDTIFIKGIDIADDVGILKYNHISNEILNLVNNEFELKSIGCEYIPIFRFEGKSGSLAAYGFVDKLNDLWYLFDNVVGCHCAIWIDDNVINISIKSHKTLEELATIQWDKASPPDIYDLHLTELKDKTTAKKALKKMKAVPPAAFINQQIDLFRDFLVNTDDERDRQSNAIDLWDSVPRYFITRAKQAKLRVQGGFLPIAEREFQYQGRFLTAEIRPARIKTTDKNGKTTTLEIYPSAREELIEHALRKLASEQQAGFHDASSDFRSGVTFSLYQLRAELESRGHSMRYDELVESLDVMNLANIRLLDKDANGDDPSFISQPYLPALVKVTKEGISNDPRAKWLVQFHSALTASIAQLSYRQFNYQRLMACQSQLSRWLLNQLVLKYTFAAPGNTFKMLYSTIQRDSGLLDNYKRTRDAVDALDEAFEELKREGVLMNIIKEARTGARGKILDVLYILSASVKFSYEQKAANKRKNNGTNTLAAVDNSQKLK